MRTGHPGTDPASIDVQTILLVTTAGLILQRVDHRDAVAVIPADGDGRPRVDAVEVTTTAGPLFPIDLTEQLVTPGYRPLVPDRLPAGTALVIDLGRHTVDVQATPVHVATAAQTRFRILGAIGHEGDDQP